MEECLQWSNLIQKIQKIHSNMSENNQESKVHNDQEQNFTSLNVGSKTDQMNSNGSELDEKDGEKQMLKHFKKISRDVQYQEVILSSNKGNQNDLSRSISLSRMVLFTLPLYYLTAFWRLILFRFL